MTKIECKAKECCLGGGGEGEGAAPQLRPMAQPQSTHTAFFLIMQLHPRVHTQLCETAAQMPEGRVRTFHWGPHSFQNQTKALLSEQFPKSPQYIHFQKVNTLGANPHRKAA